MNQGYPSGLVVINRYPRGTRGVVRDVSARMSGHTIKEVLKLGRITLLNHSRLQESAPSMSRPRSNVPLKTQKNIVVATIACIGIQIQRGASGLQPRDAVHQESKWVITIASINGKTRLDLD